MAQSLLTQNGLYTWFGESVTCICGHHINRHIIHFIIKNEDNNVKRKDRKYDLRSCINCDKCFKFRPQTIDFGKISYTDFKKSFGIV